MVFLRSVKLTTALAALALFFLPWLDIQCSGKSLATQTGIQAITGEVTPTDKIEGRMEAARQESFGSAELVRAALLAVGLGIACLLGALVMRKYQLDALGSLLCALALMLLLAQLMQGFPIKEEIIASVSADQATADADMGVSIAMMVATSIEVQILPAFVVSCVLLGMPLVLYVGEMLVRLGMRGKSTG